MAEGLSGGGRKTGASGNVRLVDMKTEICAAIDTLPEEKHRNVLERFYLQGMTNREIADELGYEERTVYRLKQQAEKKLENLKVVRK